MREISYHTLIDQQEVNLNDSQISINRVMLPNANKVVFEPVESLLVRVDVLNSEDQVVASISVGSNERLLVNEDWSYIERV